MAQGCERLPSEPSRPLQAPGAAWAAVASLKRGPRALFSESSHQHA